MTRARVVSVTPLSVDTDSRTFKIAASAGRLGYESVVIEGHGSCLPADGLPFQLRSVGPRRTTQAGRAEGEQAVIPSLVQRVLDSILLPVRLMRHWLRVVPQIPRASLYYVHSFDLFPAVWVSARRYRVPYVYDAHDMYSVLRRDGRPLPLDVRFEELVCKVIERWCLRGAAEVVTVGEGIADLHQRAFGRRPIVVRNAHDARMDEEPELTVRAACGLDPEDDLLAVSGNLKPGMALGPLLAALSRLPDRVHLALIGAGYDGVGREIRALGLESRVHTFAPLPPTQIVPFLRSADLAPVIYQPLTANLANALPNGFFHAVAAGIPVLYPSELPELSSLVARAGSGVPIDPSDSTALARRIREVLDDPAERARLKEAASRAAATLRWEDEETALETLLSELLTTGGRRR